jgi:hypothetical protein
LSSEGISTSRMSPLRSWPATAESCTANRCCITSTIRLDETIHPDRRLYTQPGSWPNSRIGPASDAREAASSTCHA